jgi:hypothetical protein
MMRTSGAACARACASECNAHVPWDTELPAELWLVVLRHMSLMQLRLLKTVSHSMANRCRRVLRSKEWQAWSANDYALELEVATQATQSYALPMTVRILDDHLQMRPLHGTIHRLKLKLVRRVTTDVRAIDSLVGTNWSFFRLSDEGDVDVQVVDMLIEVRGYGLCGSEYTLRRLLADVVLGGSHAVENHQAADHLARKLCDTRITQEVEEDGTPSWGDVEENGCQMPFWQLLQQIGPVTNVGGELEWAMHRVTHQNNHGRDVAYLDALHLCANFPGLLT